MIIRLACAVLAIFIVTVSGALRAQGYPTGPVRILVPVPPGGPLDLTARVLAEHFGAAWERPVIVENRPGGGTLVAARLALQAEPNGHTLLITTSSISSFSAFFKNPGIDIAKDVTFISMIAKVPMFLAVSASASYATVQDLVKAARAQPLTLNYAGYGNANRVMSELLNKSLGVQLTHIGFSGASPAAQALVRGDVATMLDSMSTLSPLIAANKVRVLAVTERTRVPSHPQIPTIAEAGFDMPEFGIWYALVGPAGIAPSIVEKLAGEIGAFARSGKAASRLAPFGFALAASTPTELRELALRAERIFTEMAQALAIERE